eukprot:CAMPEP_0179216700 /NCGR_PEP_ID=MMETSP0797-20121207/3521_1 /TAXON_ID=47934 /ORGANISM="Dinophysis acuminata, Strain DAEP01" /LENGTH=489 /DNA_ID=CAMNT_0020922881 /DNA_START=89 /DNA_END=1558 /DNA_ORIENTATION=+
MGILRVSLCGIPDDKVQPLSQLLAEEVSDVVEHVDIFTGRRFMIGATPAETPAPTPAPSPHHGQASDARQNFGGSTSNLEVVVEMPQLEAMAETDSQTAVGGLVTVHQFVLKIRPQYLTGLIKVAKGFGIGDTFGSIDVQEVTCTTDAAAAEAAAQGRGRRRLRQMGQLPIPAVPPRALRTVRRAVLLRVLARPEVDARDPHVRGGHKLPDLEPPPVVVLASGIAAVGLLTDSSPFILAAFFISPLMQMIMAVVWGCCISDRALVVRGLRNMLAGASLCVTLGACIGAALCAVTDQETLALPVRSGVGYSINTDAILSRGPPNINVVASAIISSLSGVAMALGQSSGIQSALAGVALSTSLLAPVVNAGLTWSVQFCFPGMVTKDNYAVGRVGNYSLYLYLVNVSCIMIFAWTTLKFKHVGGRTLRSMGSSTNACGGDGVTEWDVVRNFEPLLDRSSAQARADVVPRARTMSMHHDPLLSPRRRRSLTL